MKATDMKSFGVKLCLILQVRCHNLLNPRDTEATEIVQYFN